MERRALVTTYFSRTLPLMLTVLLGASACTSQKSETIRLALVAMPANLDPPFYTSTMAARMGRLDYDRPVDFDIRSDVLAAFCGDIKAPDIFRYAFHGRALPPNGARYQGNLVDILIGSTRHERGLITVRRVQ